MSKKTTFEQEILDLLLNNSNKNECVLSNKDILSLTSGKSIASVDRALARLKKKNFIETINRRVIKIK